MRWIVGHQICGCGCQLCKTKYLNGDAETKLELGKDFWTKGINIKIYETFSCQNWYFNSFNFFIFFYCFMIIFLRLQKQRQVEYIVKLHLRNWDLKLYLDFRMKTTSTKIQKEVMFLREQEFIKQLILSQNLSHAMNIQIYEYMK